MTSYREEKILIREQAKKTRNMLHIDGDAGEHLSARFFDIFAPSITTDSVIGLYWPLGKECDTLPLIDDLLAKGYKVALPYIHAGDTALDFYVWTQDMPLTQSAFGAMHPDVKIGQFGDAVTPDALLLPLLAYDRKGNRLGYGAGHYDRYIESLKAQGHDPLRIGIAYMEQICLYPLPAEPHDIPLDCVLNPNGYTRFSARAPEQK